ncbi:MAG: cell division protein FtsQ/DivIB [Gammaproteobacteria bacterium]|nr:cell division protein FtsQ/DivIB [Gammaproteobacteria bacterium]
MFSFRNKAAQARKKFRANRPELVWRSSYGWLLMLLALLGGTGYLSYRDTLLPIRTIQLSGSFQNIDQQAVQSSLQQFIGEGFFSLDINRVQKSLSDKPWTDSVSIRRVWPDRLKIVVIENKPVARWDSDHLISDKAVVFAAATGAFGHLPIVNSASDSPGQMLGLFYRLETRFEKLNEQVAVLRKDSRGALEIQLESGLTIKLGRMDIERKITRFVAIYRQHIYPRRDQIQALDLRYSNGFAVAWKKEVLQSRDEASLWGNNNV